MNRLFYIMIALFIAPHVSFAEIDSFQFLDTEDESMIIESLPIDEADSAPAEVKFSADTHLTAKPEDIFRAKVVAIVNKSEIYGHGQTVRVYRDGKIIYKWLISTGREKLEKSSSGRVYWTVTPVGYFRPTKLEVNHRSLTWGADMPYSVFFTGGVALHEGHALEKLGMRASGGCVRLSAESAKLFFELVSGLGTSSVAAINRDGTIKVGADGNPVMVENYDALIIVENPEAL